jgi:hypothetical protein
MNSAALQPLDSAALQPPDSAALHPMDYVAIQHPLDHQYEQLRSEPVNTRALVREGVGAMNGEVSPTASIDSLDLPRHVPWGMNSQDMAASPATQPNALTQRDKTPSPSERLATAKYFHWPFVKGDDCLPEKESSSDDLLLTTSEQSVWGGMHSSSGKLSREMEKPPHTSQSTTFAYHLSHLPYRSLALNLHDPSVGSHHITHRLSMLEHVSELPSGVDSTELSDTPVGVAGSAMTNIGVPMPSDRSPSRLIDPAFEFDFRFDSFSVNEKLDPADSNGGYMDEAAQELLSDAEQPNTTSRPYSFAQELHDIRQYEPASCPRSGVRRSRSKQKLEKVTGEPNEQLNNPNINNKTQKVILPNTRRSQLKVEQITGEQIESLSYPVVGVVPHLHSSSREVQLDRNERSSLSRTESITSEWTEKGSITRSRSWRKSVRKSLTMIGFQTISRSHSQDREGAEQERGSSRKQRSKLQKRPSVSKGTPRASSGHS